MNTLVDETYAVKLNVIGDNPLINTIFDWLESHVGERQYEWACRGQWNGRTDLLVSFARQNDLLLFEIVWSEYIV